MTNHTTLLQERNFKVNYEQVSDSLWRTTAELTDEIHHIRTWLDISTPDLIVQDAGIEFIKMPFEECNLICEKAKKLVGTKAQKLGFKIFRLFLGSSGCPNVYLLFGISGPAFYSIYNLNLVNDCKMSQNDYNILMKKTCVAHKRIVKNI
jgi:hypothetical protein